MFIFQYNYRIVFLYCRDDASSLHNQIMYTFRINEAFIFSSVFLHFMYLEKIITIKKDEKG
jgi:hypothetical protein